MAVMKLMAAIFFLAFCLGVAFEAPASFAADQAQAREVARMNNCPPKKIEVYQQSLGSQGQTVYRVECAMPKNSNADAANAASALLVSCDENLCELLRPLPPDTK